MTRSATLSLPTPSAAPAIEPACLRSAGRSFAARISCERGDVWLSLPLRHLGERTVRIAYEWQGVHDAPVLVALGGISAHRHVASHGRDAAPGWWQAQAGEGLPLDPHRYRILSIDWLGADGRIDGAIDSADQADALAAVLDALAIRRVEAVIGASYGAMVGLAFAARHPQRLKQLVAISGGHRAHPYASAWRSIQRNIVRLAREPDQRAQALSLARQLALLSYRSAEEFGQRFDQAPSAAGDRFEVAAEPYLHARGQAFARDFDATAFLRLSESIDLHRVDPADVRAPVTVVGIDSDVLVPLADLRELAAQAPQLKRLVTFDSLYGHDAFLKEERAIADILLTALHGERCEVAA